VINSLATPRSPQVWTAWQKTGALLALVTLYFFVAFYHLADLPLLDPDEPRYATAGRSMAEGGSWLIPEFNGAPRINKPPLFYWLIAVSDLVCGQSNEVTARLPSIVMGLLMLCMTVWVGMRVYDLATGWLAGLILITSPLFITLSRGCVIDQTFSTLLSAALFCHVLGLTGHWPWLKYNADGTAKTDALRSPIFWAGLLAGLAFLAKGTATLLVVFVPLLFALLFCRGTLRYWRSGPWLLAVVLALVMAAWWYVLLYVQFGHDRFRELFSVEILGRLAGKMHQESPLYYFYILPGVFFPWSVPLIPALICACRRIAPSLPDSQPDLPEPDAQGKHLDRCGGNVSASWRHRPFAAEPQQVSDTFLVAWIGGVVILFTIPGAKLASYMLPAFPALALLTARFVLRIADRGGSLSFKIRMLTLSVAVLFGLAVFVYLSGLFSPSIFRLKKDVQGTLDNLPIPQVVLAALLGVLAAAPWTLLVLTRRVRLTVGITATFVLALLFFSLPRGIEALHRRSNKRLAMEVFDLAQEMKRCVSLGSDEESLVYYLKRPVREARRPDPLRNENHMDVVHETLALEPPGKLLIFVHNRYFQVWLNNQPPPGSRIITRNQHIVVLLNQQ